VMLKVRGKVDDVEDDLGKKIKPSCTRFLIQILGLVNRKKERRPDVQMHQYQRSINVKRLDDAGLLIHDALSAQLVV